MEPAYSAFVPRKCVADLSDTFSETSLPEFIGTKKAAKKTTLILDGPALYNHKPGNGSGLKIEAVCKCALSHFKSAKKL